MKNNFIIIMLGLIVNTANAQQLNDLKVGDTLPPLTVSYLSGDSIKTRTLQTFYQDNFVIIDFWANWCGACIRAMQAADSVCSKFNGQVKVLPVTYQDWQTIKAFVHENTILNKLKLDYTFIKSDSVTLTSSRSVLFRKTMLRNKDDHIRQVFQNDNKYLNQNLTVGVEREEKRQGGRKNFQLLNSSIIDFDFNGLGGISVTSAKLSFKAKPYNDTVYLKDDYLGSDPHIGSGIFRDQYSNYLNSKVSYDISYGNGFNLERVSTSWGPSNLTNMDNIAIRHENKVQVGNASNATCTDLNNLECGSLIKEILSSDGSNGIMFSIPEIVLLGGDKDARRSRSFYSGFNYNPSDEDACKLGIDHYGNHIEPQKPTLTIYYTTSKDTCVKLCRPNIDSASVNPYIWGILGNWRMNRTYNYYGQRKETDLNSSLITDARTNEQIQSFVPYWAFNSAYLIPGTDTSKWVWNSEITQFNRKGTEIENKDPLNRYNSGQYGYNQSLPVAVTQNSKLRNAVFDGFEDYDYKTNSCNELCATARFIDFVSGGGTKDSVYRHTGKFSLKLAGNQTTTTVIPLVPLSQDSIPYSLTTKPDSVVNSVNTKITGKGNGLLIKYGIYNADMSSINPCVNHVIHSVEWSGQTEIGNVNKDWGTGHPEQICASDYFNVQWNGYVQPRFNDYYTFKTVFDGAVKVFINGEEMISAFTMPGRIRTRSSPQKYLEQGKLYTISVFYSATTLNSSIQLLWSSSHQAYEVVPPSNLYTPTVTTSDTLGSVISIPQYCVKYKSPKPNNLTLKTFSPIAGTKMIITAWLKEDQQCLSGNYNSSSIDIAFTGSGNTFQFKPKGNIIEGWQRIEDTLNIPLTATALSVKLRSLSSAAVNFDDIRLHPFNALMKSCVYDPVSLRLMAELDENNYASFYEYDDDGTLTRVKKETERGIKTIQETRSALLKDQ